MSERIFHDPERPDDAGPLNTDDLGVVALYLMTKGQEVGAQLVQRAIAELHSHRLRDAVIEASVTDWWNGRPAPAVVEEIWTALVVSKVSDA